MKREREREREREIERERERERDDSYVKTQMSDVEKTSLFSFL